MSHRLSSDDQQFKREVEASTFPVADFDHRAHVRLAYIYLVDNSVDQSHQLVKEALIGLLRHNNIDPAAKYHETLTKAWLLAVNYFMSQTPDSQCTAEFIENTPVLLNSNIMMSHYSPDCLFSEEARKAYIEADLNPIPVSH